ncbi:MAG: WD40/YVTN/BNR-like repeat-containing protein, partial [Solirubrobacteraceae bacterium]
GARAASGVAAARAASSSSLAAFAPAASARHPIPNPLGAIRYLSEQRAGYGHGNPVKAGRLAAHADAVARSLRSVPQPPRPSVNGAIPSVNGAIPAVAPNTAGPNLTQAWQPLGPAPVIESYYGQNNSGRVDSVAVAPSGKIYIGTAGGGVWSSANDGGTWVTHTDNVPTGLAIGALAIDPENEEVVYAGTGEANNCGDCFYGGGVLKSTDGGETWEVENPKGIFSGVDFASLAVDPHNANVVYAATNRGFYISTDGGGEWSHPSTANGYVEGATWGLAIDPTTNPSTIYIATSGVGVQKSTDGGEHFKTLAGGLPAAANFGVAELGIGTRTPTHEHGNETLYAAVQLNGATGPGGGDIAIYKTTDGGTTWLELAKAPAYTDPSYAYEGTAKGDAGDQAFYDNAIAVDPEDPEHVIAAGIAAVESKDGGTTWTNINGGDFKPEPPEPRVNAIHPDFHAIAFATSTAGGISKGESLIGCDGGIYRYYPAAAGGAGGPTGVANLNHKGSGLDISQFYEGLAVHESGSSILGGLQDNGTAYLAAAGAGNQPWKDVLAGDGGYSAINPLHPQQQFGEADQSLSETTKGWEHEEFTELKIGPNDEGKNGNFSSPLKLVPNAREPEAPSVFYGGNELWVSRDPNVATPTWAAILKAGQAGTAERPNNVSAIAVALAEPEVMYVGFNYGELFVTTDAGAATPTFTGLANGVQQWITHISVSPTDPGSIALSYSDSNDQTSSQPPMVQTATVTLTGTPAATFTNITGNLPAGVASNSVVFDNGALVAATDVGVFSTDAPNGEATAWTSVGAGLPNVQVLGLTVDEQGNLYAATHGRGLWKLIVPPAPKSTAAPSIAGATRVGETLTAQDGGWEGGPTSFTYRWLLCNQAGTSCAGIAGATANTYTLTAQDAGHTLRVEVTAESADGDTAAESAPSAVVQPALTTTTTTTTTSTTTPAAPTATTTTTTTKTSATATTTHAPAKGTAIAAGAAAVVRGKAQLVLRCDGGSCSGRVLLKVSIVKRVRKGRRFIRRRELITIGSASFALASGAHRTLAVHLSATGARLLRQAGRRGSRVKLTGSGVKSGSVLLKVRSSRRARRRLRKKR